MEIYHQRHASHILLVSLLLLCCCTGGQQMTVVTSVGEDVVLPCDAGTDATTLTVKWNRSPVHPGDQHVFFWRNGGEDLSNKNPSYVGRTSLFTDELKKGNVSLKLSKVKSSDEGNYICNLPDISKTSAVHLTFKVSPEPPSPDTGLIVVAILCALSMLANVIAIIIVVLKRYGKGVL